LSQDRIHSESNLLGGSTAERWRCGQTVVFSTASKKYAALSADKTLSYELDKEMKVGITTGVGGAQCLCKALIRRMATTR
jgi:hypothetical protein